MFKPKPNEKESANLTDNKLIIKVNKKALQACEVKPKKLTPDTQEVQPSIETTEEALFEIY
jgi:hypothetical protein